MTQKKKSTAKKTKSMEDVGAEVAKIMNSAVLKANKVLKKYGYFVSVEANFHNLEDQDLKEAHDTISS